METRAPYALIGVFVLAVIGAVFGFVYWLNNAGGLGERRDLPRPVRYAGVGPAGRRGGAVQRHSRRRGDRAEAAAGQAEAGRGDHLRRRGVRR